MFAWCGYIVQFDILMGVLREMLDQIDRQRRSKMMSEVPDHNALEHRYVSDVMTELTAWMKSSWRNCPYLVID